MGKNKWMGVKPQSLQLHCPGVSPYVAGCISPCRSSHPKKKPTPRAPPRAASSSPVLPQRASLGSVRPWAVARARRPIRCCTRDPGNYRCSQLPCAPPSTSMAHSKLLGDGPAPSEVAWPAQPDPHALVCSCTRPLRCVCWLSRCSGCTFVLPELPHGSSSEAAGLGHVWTQWCDSLLASPAVCLDFFARLCTRHPRGCPSRARGPPVSYPQLFVRACAPRP